MEIQPKKIVYIGSAHPLRGGLATFNERLSREFQNMGNDVTIYTFSLQYPSILFPGTTQYSSEPAPPDLKIKICINSINPLNWLKVGREIKKLRPDIIVIKFWMPFMGACFGSILRLAKKNKHTRVVCILDNMIPHEKRIGDEMLTKYFIKPVDAFIAMSDKVLVDLRSFDKVKPAMLHPHPLFDNFGPIMPKQIARKELGIDEDEKILLFFGFIRKYKGLDILLDAMKLVIDRNATQTGGLKLLIAGEFYEDRKSFEEQVERLGIKNQLLLHTDFIPDSKVKYYLCAADVVVQPYRNATQSGVTPLAYHFEKPMIVTNVGGLPEMVPDEIAGLVAEPNAESIAEKIEYFFTKPSDHYLSGLREEKKKYSWSKLADTVLNIF